MRDVLKFPDDSLAKRVERLGSSRAGVYQILSSLGAKRLAVREGGKWALTLDGRKWLRPTTRGGA